MEADATHRSHSAIPLRPNCFPPEHYKRAANNLLSWEGVCWIAHAKPLYSHQPNSCPRHIQRSRGRAAAKFAEGRTWTRKLSAKAGQPFTRVGRPSADCARLGWRSGAVLIRSMGTPTKIYARASRLLPPPDIRCALRSAKYELDGWNTKRSPT